MSHGATSHARAGDVPNHAQVSMLAMASALRAQPGQAAGSTPAWTGWGGISPLTSPGPLLVPTRERQKHLLWQDRRSQGLGSTSLLPHGVSSCPCVLLHGKRLRRRSPLPMDWGAVGPEAASPLFLQLPRAEGAVAGHAAGVSRGDAAGAAGQGNTAPRLGRCPRG